MAKRRRHRTSSAPRTQIVRAPSPARPIIIRQSSAPLARRSGKRRGSGGKHHKSGTAGLIASATGGALLGFIDQSFGAKLPTIPLLGRAGTIAVGAYMLSKHSKSGMLRDVAIAAAAVAGYEIGTKGSVSGMIPNQVRGVAAQV